MSAAKTVSIRWFPPSWFQIKAGGKVIYIDPAYIKKHYKKYPGKIEYTNWPEPIDGLPEELEKAGLILITHHHKDHCKSVTVNRLRRRDTIVLAPKSCIKELGENIRVVETGDEIAHEDTRIRVVDAYNTKEGSSTRKVHHKGRCVGYLIDVKGKIIYHAGDTDLIPEMKELGTLDLALLPIGGTFTMDVEEAVRAAKTINPNIVVPMHHQRTDLREFSQRLAEETDVEVILLEMGQALDI